MKLGFSTGTLYRTHSQKEALKVIGDLGCACVELGFIRLNDMNEFDKITAEDLKGFDYVSFHTPKFEYDNGRESAAILNKIKNFDDNVRKLDLAVFHPDNLKEFSSLDSIGLPIGIENMDSRKISYKNAADFKIILAEHPNFNLVFDVNHIYTNDPSMKLAAEFYREFGSRIAEIHLSGFAGLHEPIFETKQAEILKSIQNPDVPIIIESLLNSGNIKKEKEYIEEWFFAEH